MQSIIEFGGNEDGKVRIVLPFRRDFRDRLETRVGTTSSGTAAVELKSIEPIPERPFA
jgi:hypothetical protein